jgi:hypothetical protein
VKKCDLTVEGAVRGTGVSMFEEGAALTAAAR